VPFGIGALDHTAIGQRGRHQSIPHIPFLQGLAAHGIGLADATPKSVIAPAQFVLQHAVGAIEFFFKGASIEGMGSDGFDTGHAIGVGLPAGSGQRYRVGQSVLGDAVRRRFGQHIAPIIKGTFGGHAQGRSVFVTGVIAGLPKYPTEHVIFASPGGIGLTAVGLFLTSHLATHTIQPDRFLTPGSADSGLAALVR